MGAPTTDITTANFEDGTDSIPPGALPLQPKLTPAMGVSGIILMASGLALAFIGIRNLWCAGSPVGCGRYLLTSTRVHVFLSTAFLASLGVVVSCSMRTQGHSNICRLGINCLRDEPTRQRRNTRGIPRRRVLHRNYIWGNGYCVQGTYRRTWVSAGRILSEHVASRAEAWRSPYRVSEQERVHRCDISRGLRFVVQPLHSFLWIDWVHGILRWHGAYAGHRLL